jgi:hypothetical protein
MVETKGTRPRPLKVFVKGGSRAEYICRMYAARGEPSIKEKQTEAEAAAAGFTPRPALNLRDHGGKIITDLVYTNFFVGGSAWNQQDRDNIDQSLAKAMSDQGLNNVLIQYFRGAQEITSTFRPSRLLQGAPPASISQTEVEQLVQRLHDDDSLNGFDFGSTVFNFMLPRGTVLTIDDGSGDEARPGAVRTGETEEKANSLNGLGGFHGSVRNGRARIYYAVGVFSEGGNGIVAFDQSWKNVVATFYHELIEARTDADVEENEVAWVNDEQPGEEIGDIPMSLAGGNLSKVMKEVRLADGSGTVPIQLMWSNAVGAPEGPIARPHAPPAVA